MNGCILLALVAFDVFVAMSHGATKEDTSLVKNFVKINNYLEKEVNSDDFETNIEEAEKWLEEKSGLSLLFDRSFKQALKLFISLPEVMENVTTCNNEKSRILLKKFDDALSDEAHLNTKNYPLKRIDRILESVAYESVRICVLSLAKNEYRYPSMDFTFKQLAYDYLNEDLVGRLADDDDPEINMETAERILRSLNYKQGSYARALEQLLSLRSILTGDLCNEQGTEIVMKNDLATRGETHTMQFASLRRIGKLVHHYSARFASVCQATHQRNCLTRLNQLEPRTYRRVLVLASADYLGEGKLNDLMDEVSRKQVGQNFTTQLLEELDESNSRVLYPRDKLFLYLKVATKRDLRSRFLKIVDKKLYSRNLVDFNIKELYNEYIHEPCQQFNSIMRPDIEIFDYLNPHKVDSSSSTYNISHSWPLNFRLLYSAFYSCKLVLNDREYYMHGLMEALRNSG